MSENSLETKPERGHRSQFPLVGVLGAGQLGGMLALAGIPMGVRFRFLDPAPNSPAGQIAPCLTGSYEDEETLAQFVEGVDVVTYEFENVPVETVRRLSQHVPVYPPPQALETAQDRLNEKNLFVRLGIETPFFAAISHFEELQAALRQTGFPAVLKTRRFGYDGKGQWVLRSEEDAKAVWERIQSDSHSIDANLILEAFVSFDREVSLIASRSVSGKIVCYPLIENKHDGGVLRLSTLPAPDISPQTEAKAEKIMTDLMRELDYVGILTIEFFLCGDLLVANEIAPRVHNSGHGTIEGCVTSQFENHVRAILDLPLGDPSPRGRSFMWNILGAFPEIEEALRIPGCHLHLYGKEARPGRKIGHATLVGVSHSDLQESLSALKTIAPQL